MLYITKELDPEIRDKVVEKTAEIIRDQYALPEIGKKISDLLQEKLDGGRYSAFHTVSEFCSALRYDLQDISQDLHLGVFHLPATAAKLRDTSPDDADPDWWYNRHRVMNHGLVKAEYMAGNVGYLDIQLFAPLYDAKDIAIQMMNYISNCEALIIDLRNNGGGDRHIVQLIESYFFEGESKLLLTLYNRPSDTYEQIRTIPQLPGKPMPTIPIYILTSKRTFSGGEDFAYTLKHHGRALIVGESTGGGAHTVDQKLVYDDFVIVIPTGYAIHPETKANWEGTGVEPDIAVPHEQALGAAHIHAIETLIAQTSDEERARRLKWKLERLKAIYNPIDVPKEILSQHVGTYREYYVAFRSNALSIFSHKDKRIQWDLYPISRVLYGIKNDDEYNVQFEIEESGKAAALVFLHWSRDEGTPISRTDD